MNKLYLLLIAHSLFGFCDNTLNTSGHSSKQHKELCTKYSDSFYSYASSNNYYNLKYSSLSFIQLVENGCYYDNDDLIIAKMVDIKLQLVEKKTNEIK
jgi:hypothetical protein